MAFSKQISYLALAASLSLGSAVTQAEVITDKPTAGSMTLDLLVARPLGVVTTALGTAVYVATLPFSLLGGNADESAEILVLTPLEMTFFRCLGCRNTEEASDGPTKNYLRLGYQKGSYFNEYSSNGFNLAFGRRVFEIDRFYIDAEANYTDFGTSEDIDIVIDATTTLTRTFSGNSYGVGGNFGINLTDFVSAYGKLGVQSWEINQKQDQTADVEVDGVDLSYGAGIALNLSSRADINFEYNRQNFSDTGLDDEFISSLGVDLTLKF